jgi:hypothetical protein
MTVQTAVAARQTDPPSTGTGHKVEPIAWAILLMSLFGARTMRREGRKMMFMAMLLLSSIAATATLTGCSSSRGSSSSEVTDYTITVTATSGSLQHSFTVSLNLR